MEFEIKPSDLVEIEKVRAALAALDVDLTLQSAP
jgi:hypothetical protein